MQIQQALQTPFGISTFGSSIVRVDPDIASLKFTVSRLEQHPKEAFRQAHAMNCFLPFNRWQIQLI